MSLVGEVILGQVIDQATQSMYSWCSNGKVSVKHCSSGDREELEFGVLPAEIKNRLKKAFENIFKVLSSQEQDKLINRFQYQLAKISMNLPLSVRKKLKEKK